MVIDIKIFKVIFRHRWDGGLSRFDPTFKSYRLGLWIKPYKAIASKSNYMKDGKISHVHGYMIGLDLIIAKTWIDISFGKKLTIETR
jgi:hypothetical protein